jgi:IS605 OrfB family transposase
MQRTIVARLEPSQTQVAALAETSGRFTAVFNEVCAYGWQHAEKNGVRLHHALYYPLKAAHPKLVSDLHIQARVRATESIKSALTRRRQGRRTSQPHSTACPPRYNPHTFRVDWESRTVRLSTTTGRQTIRFSVPDCAGKYVGAETDTADLIERGGHWYLHVAVTVPAPDVVPVDAAVGIDFGLDQPAVTSNNHFLGKKSWQATEGRLFKIKRALQKKGTKSAKRHLRKLRHKQARFRRDCGHVLSKQIVHLSEKGATIALENLTDIRSRVRAKRRTETKRRLHGWSFAQLRAFIEYKAEEWGCTVVGVDPRHTSQRCSRCGHTARNNRRSRACFQCRSCGFTLHADLNGARNIAAKYRAQIGSAGLSGQPVNLPIAGAGELVHSATCKPSPSGVGR